MDFPTPGNTKDLLTPIELGIAFSPAVADFDPLNRDCIHIIPEDEDANPPIELFHFLVEDDEDSVNAMIQDYLSLASILNFIPPHPETNTSLSLPYMYRVDNDREGELNFSCCLCAYPHDDQCWKAFLFFRFPGHKSLVGVAAIFDSTSEIITEFLQLHEEKVKKSYDFTYTSL